MTIGFTTSGLSLATLTNSAGTINFAAQELFAVAVRNRSTEAIGEEVLGNVTGQVVDPDGSTHTTYISTLPGDLYTCKLHGVLDDTSGVESIKLRPEIAMGADLKAGYSFSYGMVSLKVPLIGTLANGRVLLPGAHNQVIGWAQVPTSESKWANPGLIWLGGEDPLNPSGDTADLNQVSSPKTNEADYASSADFHGYTACWDKASGLGVLFRFTDIKGRGKIISIQQVGTDLVFRFRFIPIDRILGVNGASDEDFDYSIEVRPFLSPDPATAWYDVARYDADRKLAEGHPAGDAGRILDRPSTGAWALPDSVRNMDAFGVMTTGDSSDGFDFSLFSENVANLVGAFSIAAARWIFSIYNYWAGVIGDDFPTVIEQTGYSEAHADIVATGVVPILYSIPIANGLWDGSTGLPPGLGINDNLSVDQDGALIVGETPVLGSDSGGAVYVQPSFANATNNAELLDFIIDQLKAIVGTDFRGLYSDAFNAYGPPLNSDTTLNPDDRGFGSKTWWTNALAVLELHRTRLAAKGITDPIVTTEHPQPLTVGRKDICFVDLIGPGRSYLGPDNAEWDYVTPRVPTFAVAWSERQIMSDFASFGDGPAGIISEIPGYATEVERFNALHSFNWHNHQRPSFLRFFATSLNVYCPADRSQAYQDWIDYTERMFFKNAAAVRHWSTCKKLRDLPLCQHERSIEAAVAEDISDVLVAGAKLHHSTLYDSDNDEMVIRLSNWSLDGHNPASVQMSATIATAKWPEMGTAARDVWLWNFGTQHMLPMTSKAVGSSHAINLSIPAGFVGVLMMVPAGVDPTFQGRRLAASAAVATGSKLNSIVATGSLS